MNLIKASDGCFHVTFATKKGTQGDVNLGTADVAKATEMVKEMHVKELETVSSIVNLSHQVVTQIIAGKDLSVGDAVVAWNESCTSSRVLSPTTVYANRNFLTAWAKEVGVYDRPLSSVQPKHVSDYLNRGGEKRSSALRKLAAIRNFFGYCQEEGLLYRNPAGKRLVKVTYNAFKHEEIESGEREIFTEAELAGLLVVASSFWRAAITISRETGLRLGDISKLEWASFKDGRLVVWTDKADKRVDLPISPAISEAMGALSSTGIEYCFPEQREISLDPSRKALLSVQFSRLCAKAGVHGKSFHCLRHTNATNLVSGGMERQDVAKRLGHSSPTTTDGYIHVSNST